MFGLFSRKKNRFPIFRQLDKMDCGPACLKIIAKYFGKEISFKSIKTQTYLTKQGVSLGGIISAAEYFGFDTLPVRAGYDELKEKVNLPCIAHWKNNHFIVIYKVFNNKVFVSDPKIGLHQYNIDRFKKGWLNANNDKGILLLLEPTNRFFELGQGYDSTKTDVFFLKQYFTPYKLLIFQILFGICVLSLIQLTLPFLTKALVDYGINNQDIGFIYLVGIAQIAFFIFLATINILRGWILLHISTRIKIKIISDFLHKLLKLPIAYFQSKQNGDILQRIYDHHRINRFLSNNSLTSLFGIINIVLFSIVLAYFNLQIFFIFMVGSALYFPWTLLFMNSRASIDLEQFEERSANRSSLIQLVESITEVKLNGSERRRKNEWKNIQLRLFNVSLKGLKLFNKQIQGGTVLNEIKNIVIILFAAKFVIEGSITLGTMLAIQFIVGQINGPINDIISFFFTLQDANISIQRLSEVHNAIEEDLNTGNSSKVLYNDADLELKNVTFRYGPPGSKDILRNINLRIPRGKVTAIVGPSGSGKTTLLKLLLKFYEPIQGDILLNDENLANYNTSDWRKNCGVVMQEGYIFNDTLRNNITESNSISAYDDDLFNKAIDVANLNELIEQLPNNEYNFLGPNGSILSGGERQRILIARAIYKKPKYLLFDEATSNLDSTNEKLINDSLSKFFHNKTVIIIAHRLSTVKNADKNADQIVVLNQGEIKEVGKHQDLIDLKGKYFELIKNQL